MLTEEEAKTKRCCLWISNTSPFQDAHCIASQCMAWRWVTDEPEPLGFEVGFCGLAGKIDQ